MVPQHVLYDSMVPHTLYGIGILWSPLILYRTGIVWSPTCMYGPLTCEASSCLIWLLWSPHTLYGIGIVLSPHMDDMMSMTIMVPPYLIWNRYHMIPPLVHMVPLPYMDQLSYGPPHVHVVPPTC